MATAKDILDRLGGLTAVARGIGEMTGRPCPLTTVQGWQDSNYFPDWRRGNLLALAERLGKDLAISEFPSVEERTTRKQRIAA
jgi:hypothetical protein